MDWVRDYLKAETTNLPCRMLFRLPPELVLAVLLQLRQDDLIRLMWLSRAYREALKQHIHFRLSYGFYKGLSKNLLTTMRNLHGPKEEISM